MTNQEIKTVGQTIAQETQIGGNTAARVGGVVEGIGVAFDNKDAANGYYQATISGGTVTVNAPNYLLGSGGNLRIKMPSAGTTASTLTIGNASAVQLWYNGAAVSAQNTWEADEIISVFYDGTRFMASNSQGGGGKAEKIKYDNTNNWISSDNVQGALDELAEITGEDTDNNSDLDIVDFMGNVLVRFEDGNVRTKEFNSANVRVETGDNENNSDLDISDEDGGVLVRFENGHIKTKNFDSSNIKLGQFPVPNLVGSPSLYTPAYDSIVPTLFDNSTEVYAAYDALHELYPQYFSAGNSIGLDESETYDVMHYVLGWQNPKVTTQRDGGGTNTYSEYSQKPLRLLVCAGAHPNETPSIYGCYMGIKAILESNEPWAIWIRSNLILDIVPLQQPWGLNNGHLQNNSRDVNINRTYYTNQQQENINMINLIADLRDKGLKGVIDCHNTGNSDNDGYLVSKPSYPYWRYYVELAQHLSAMMNPLFHDVFGTTKNHFHCWDSSEFDGQLHDYVNSLGLLGCTFEIRKWLASGNVVKPIVAQLTAAILPNIINSFAMYNDR